MQQRLAVPPPRLRASRTARLRLNHLILIPDDLITLICLTSLDDLIYSVYAIWHSSCHPQTAGAIMSSVTVRRRVRVQSPICSMLTLCSRARQPRAGRSVLKRSGYFAIRLCSRYYFPAGGARRGNFPRINSGFPPFAVSSSRSYVGSRRVSPTTQHVLVLSPLTRPRRLAVDPNVFDLYVGR